MSPLPEDRTDAGSPTDTPIAPRVVGMLVLLVGVGLLAAPLWSATLPAGDRPLVLVLGAVFAAIGAYAALPPAWPRLRTLALTAFMAAFGTACAALALAVNHPDGTVGVAGVGAIAGAPLPVWARLVAAFFALVCLGAAALGLWGLVRDAVRGARPDAAG